MIRDYDANAIYTIKSVPYIWDLKWIDFYYVEQSLQISPK